MGVTILEDGTIVVCSKTGVLMAARVDGKGGFVLMDTLALGDFTRTSNNEVSNSISSDGQGIFIVTQREMCRVDFNPKTGMLEVAPSLPPSLPPRLAMYPRGDGEVFCLI